MDTYKSEVSQGLSAAWKLALEQVQKAQRRQKAQHDRHARDPGFRVGDRVFVLMPAKRRGKLIISQDHLVVRTELWQCVRVVQRSS